MKTTISFEIDTALLSGFTDSYLAQLWHIAQANPAPFGERAMWPYKAWLAARKEFFAKHGLPRRVPKTPNGDLFDAGQHK